jgi:hypothetical protein
MIGTLQDAEPADISGIKRWLDSMALISLVTGNTVLSVKHIRCVLAPESMKLRRVATILKTSLTVLPLQKHVVLGIASNTITSRYPHRKQWRVFKSRNRVPLESTTDTMKYV